MVGKGGGDMGYLPQLRERKIRTRRRLVVIGRNSRRMGSNKCLDKGQVVLRERTASDAKENGYRSRIGEIAAALTPRRAAFKVPATMLV